MIKSKSKEQNCPRVNLMRLFKKHILIIFIISCSLLQGSLANGQELVPFLKGKWVGTVLFQATATGFTSVKNSINLNILEQASLKFKGNAERKSDSKNVIWDFWGYLDERGRNICFFNQNNENVLVGYIIASNLIKLYCWENRESNEITVYILRKIKTVPNT